jgi:omega-amidase
MDIILAQMAIARGKPELNRAKVMALSAGLDPHAIPAGAQRGPGAAHGKPALLVLPELFSTGFLDESSLPKEGLAAEDRAFLSALARRLECWVAGSTVEAGPPGADGNAGYRNLSLLFAPDGSERTAYRKTHPFSYGGEDRFFSQGNEIVTAEIEGWVVQPTICYDLRFPELYRAGSQRGVHLILVQANWPQARQAHWETLLRARAIENQAFVAGVNCTGTQESLAFAGGSLLLNPKGETLAQGGETEGLVRGRVDLDACKQWRKQFPALRDRRSWDFYRA